VEELHWRAGISKESSHMERIISICHAWKYISLEILERGKV